MSEKKIWIIGNLFYTGIEKKQFSLKKYWNDLPEVY